MIWVSSPCRRRVSYEKIYSLRSPEGAVTGQKSFCGRAGMKLSANCNNCRDDCEVTSESKQAIDRERKFVFRLATETGKPASVICLGCDGDTSEYTKLIVYSLCILRKCTTFYEKLLEFCKKWYEGKPLG